MIALVTPTNEAKKPIVQPLVNAEGKLTPLGEAVAQFLESEDFSKAFPKNLWEEGEPEKPADGATTPATQPVSGSPANGDPTPPTGDDKAALATAAAAAIDGGVAAEAIDLADLSGDFSHFVEEELATTKGLASKSLFKAVLEGHGLSLESFKKGDFTKLAEDTRKQYLKDAITKGCIVRTQNESRWVRCGKADANFAKSLKLAESRKPSSTHRRIAVANESKIAELRKTRIKPGAKGNTTESIHEHHEQFGTGAEQRSTTVNEAAKIQKGNFARLVTGGGVPTVRPLQTITEEKK